MPSFSAAHDQEYAPRFSRDGCRTEIRPDRRCESKARLGGGRRLRPYGPRANFCRRAMARAPAMRRRTFRDHLLSRKVWQRLTDGGKAFTPPREEILPERQTRVPAETPPRSAAFSGRHGNARIVSLLLWQISAASLGPLPTTGSGPRRTRRLRLRLSEEHDPVAFQHLAGFLVPAKILPSDASGGRRVKPSSDGQGGEVNVSP